MLGAELRTHIFTCVYLKEYRSPINWEGIFGMIREQSLHVPN